MNSPARIPGLRYLADYLDADTHDRLLSVLDSQPWQAVGSHRRIQFFGYWSDYAKGGLYRVGDLPGWANEIAVRLERDRLMPHVANQLVAIEYEPGQGIFSHVDAPVFADTIVSISLGSTCIMDLSNEQTGEKQELLLEPRSALVLSGEARTKWHHSIPARNVDVWMGRELRRARRVSLTFRQMISVSIAEATPSPGADLSRARHL